MKRKPVQQESTRAQQIILQLAHDDGVLQIEGLDGRSVNARAFRSCIELGWLIPTTGNVHPYLAQFWKLSPAGRDRARLQNYDD